VSAVPGVVWQSPPKTVLVGVDFGDASARALAIGGVVASAFDARLRTLHAERFEPPPYFTLEQIAALEAERRQALAAATTYLTQFAAGASAYRVDAIVVDEPPVGGEGTRRLPAGRAVHSGAMKRQRREHHDR
jgi:hypothetical protein